MSVPTTVRALLVTAPALVALGVQATPASAASVVARWEMNEGSAATTMIDSSGHGVTGRIGAEVNTHASLGSHTAFAFPHLQNSLPPTHPGHLVTVPSSGQLNPGTRDFAVSMTLRFTAAADGSNVLQKGQAMAPGGYFKLQVDAGRVSCLFRGGSGSALLVSGVLDDGGWHHVLCARSARAVTLTVDGRVTASRRTVTGRISNTAPLTIGGKASCDQRTVDCDYFTGAIDRVEIDAG